MGSSFLGVSMALNLVPGLPREEEGFAGLVRESRCEAGRIQRARAPGLSTGMALEMAAPLCSVSCAA